MTTTDPVKDLGPLDWRIAIVDQRTGRPTPEFQRRWNTQRNNNDLIGAIETGVGPPTGVPKEGQAYADISGTPAVLYIGHNGLWIREGVFKFTQLTDVPSAYTGSAGKFVRVNPGETGLEFVIPPTGSGSGTPGMDGQEGEEGPRGPPGPTGPQGPAGTSVKAGLVVVQSACGTYGAHGNAGTDITSVIMSSAPVSGNLLVAIMDYDLANADPPGASAGWTEDAHSATGSSFGKTIVFYKYAGAGESTTQVPCNVGQTFGAIFIWEISGVTGVWTTDRVRTTVLGTNVTAATSFTDGGISTLANNELVLTAIFGDNAIGYATPAAMTQIGSGTLVADQHQGATGGASGTSAVGGHYNLVPTAGTGLQDHTSTANTSFWCYAYVELQSSGTSVGPAGPQGPMGPPGMDGLDGDVGDRGKTGNTGATGATGLTGSQGPNGLDGDDGADGLSIQGPVGAVGPQGPQGFAGLDGDEGPEGFPIQGPTGPPGPTGATGPAGPQGLGLDGNDGEDGLTRQGPQGLQGPAGPPGFALDGQDGDDLFRIPGAQGPVGATGATGPQGPIGFAIDGQDGDDTSWSIAATPTGLYLPLSGGNLTGPLGINITGASATLAGTRTESTLPNNSGIIRYQGFGPNSAGTVLQYGQWDLFATITTAGSEAVTMRFFTYHGGALTQDFSINSGNLYNSGVSAANLLIDSVQNFYGQPAHSYSKQTPTTGFSVTVGNQVAFLILKPAGTLATGTITMPTTPVDGQEVNISSTQVITALTVAANTGQTLSGTITTIAANGFATWKFVLADTNWYRVG